MKELRLILLALLSLAILSCKQGSTTQTGDDNGTVENKPIQQSSDALLTGVSKAICYSGFRSGQHPDRGNGAKNPSYEETLEDLQILSKDSNFQLIRLYDSGENSELVLKVIKENNIDIKVMLGVWLHAELSNHENCAWLNEAIPQEELEANRILNRQEVAKAIELANAYPNIIVAINVGNEALVEWNDHLMDVDTVITLVKEVKSKTSQLVTVADNFDWWAKQGADLAKEVDFMAIHIYPVWGGRDIDEGMPNSIENVQEVRNAFPDARIVITEAGWASVASEFGERASEEKQEQYYNEIMAWAKEMNITTFFFEAFDEDWKGDPNNAMGAEKHWGIFTVDRKPKKVMEKLYPELK